MAGNWQSEASNSGLSYSTIYVLLLPEISAFSSRKLAVLVHVVEHMACEGPCILLITVQTLREKLVSSFQNHQ